MDGKLKYILKFLPFWLFLVFFKFGANSHFNLMPVYGEDVLPIWAVGLIIGSASLLQLSLDIPAGFILDRFGYKRLLRITTLIFMVAVSFFLWDLNFWTYISTVYIGSLGWLFFGPGINAYVISHAPREEAGNFISIRDVFGSIGIVLSSAFFVVSLLLSVKVVGLIILLILVIAYIVISISPDDIGSVHKEKKLKSQHYYIKRQYLTKTIKSISKLNPASTMLLLTGLSSSIFYSLIWFVVPLLLASHKVPGVMGWALGTFDFAVVLMGFFLGRIADRIDKKKLVFIGLLLFSIVGMILGFNFGFIFLFLGFLATIGDELSSISLWIWLNTLDKEHDEDGLISGVVNLFQDLGWAIGPVIAGFIYPVIGAGWTIAVGGMIIFVVWMVYSLKLSKDHTDFSLKYASIDKKPHVSRHKK